MLLSGKIKGVSPLRTAEQVQLSFSSARLKYCFVSFWFSVLTSVSFELGFFSRRNGGLSGPWTLEAAVFYEKGMGSTT